MSILHDALGHRFLVDADHAQLATATAEVLGCLQVGGRARPGDHRYTISRDGLLLARDDVPLGITDRPGATLRLLLRHVNAAAVRAARGLVFHAAAVEVHGSAIVLPGPSGAGKSTLAAALALRGAGLLGDELAAFDPHRDTVTGCPSAVAVERGSWGLLPQLRERIDPAVADLVEDVWLLAPDRIARSSRTWPLGAVVFPARVAGAPARLQRLERDRALRDLAATTFRLRERLGDDLPVIDDLARSGRCHALTFDDLDEACHLVLHAEALLTRPLAMT